MDKFKAPTGRISKTKADVFYRKGKKTIDYDEDGKVIGIQRPWEYQHIAYLGTPKKKQDLTKEKIFDTKYDGKPFKQKKETRIDILKKPTMKNAIGKEFHYMD